jgi:hypothetical protein
VLVVLLGGSAKDKDVVYIGKTEIQVFQNLVHETEGLGGVSEAKGHIRKFEQAERGGDGCLLDVVRMNRNLVERPYQVNFGEGGAAGKVMGVVLYVRAWIPVRYGVSVKGSVVPTGSPTAVLLGHQMKCG